MCVVKKFARSKKNPMASTANHKEMFDLIQSDWPTEESEYEASGYDVPSDVPQITTVSLGKRQKLTQVCLIQSHYLLVLRVYEHLSPHFPGMMLKYCAHTSEKFCYIHEWSPKVGVLTPGELKLKDKIAASGHVNTQPKVNCSFVLVLCTCFVIV